MKELPELESPDSSEEKWHLMPNPNPENRPAWWRLPPRLRIVRAVQAALGQKHGDKAAFARLLGINPRDFGNMIINPRPEIGRSYPTIKWWNEDPGRAKAVLQLTGYTLEELLSDDLVDRASETERDPRTPEGKWVWERVLETNCLVDYPARLWPDILKVDEQIEPACRLTENEKRVVLLRFGLGKDNKGHTSEEIAQELSCTPRWVRQVGENALSKINKYHLRRLNLK